MAVNATSYQPSFAAGNWIVNVRPRVHYAPLGKWGNLFVSYYSSEVMMESVFDSQDWADTIVDVRRAFELANSGFEDEALEVLVRSQSDLLTAHDSVTGSNDYLRRHFTQWLKMLRVNMLMELSSLVASKELLAEMQLELALEESGGDGSACFCVEDFQTTLLSARLEACLCNFDECLHQLRRLTVIAGRGHFSDPRVELSVVEDLLNEVLSYLGHEDSFVSRELTSARAKCSTRAPVDDAHWALPVPIIGPLSDQMRQLISRREVELAQSLLSDDEAHRQAIEGLVGASEEWVTRVPYSVTAKERLAKSELILLESLLGVDSATTFVERVETFTVLLNDLVNENSENLFLLLKVSRWLSSLSGKMLFHHCEDEEERRTLYWVGFSCVGHAETLVKYLQEHHSVSQATALRYCLVENLMAICEEIRYDDAKAFGHRSLRNVILKTILAQDATNTLAATLSSEYQSDSFLSDPEIEKEVENWEWDLVDVDIG